MVTKKSSEIPPFIVMEVMEKAASMERQGENIIHLEVGEPDFDTPECVKEAAIRAIREGKTHYTHSLGVVELREAIAEDYYKRYRVEVSPDQILVTSGTSPAMLLLFMSLLEAGEEVILPNPYYACYPNFVRMVEGTPVFADVFEEDGFQYRPEDIRPLIGPKTKAIFVNSPANPTGNLTPPERMKAIADFGKTVVSDEIYHGLVYEGKEHSILEFTRNALVINGFSKQYAMTGWRLGYLIVPPEFIRPLQKLHQNFFISANAFVQWAGIAALREADADVARMRNLYNDRRKFIIQRLRELGFGITVEPTGAFYVLANAKRYAQKSFDFAFDILQKAKVGCTPGIDFGSNAEGYLRFSYANSIENIHEAMNRLEGYLKEHFWAREKKP
ncbi:MAG: pyridoxal phosphate-dependent aminotransferase [Deltaproteobacteria bacterium]|jgi:(5-formylfuran-3-yl)methyl phosphate transaminase|nr:pyridoxal phosphate-dependent aminotransferase [Deltaproteobacteria bacterium]